MKSSLPRSAPQEMKWTLAILGPKKQERRHRVREGFIAGKPAIPPARGVGTSKGLCNGATGIPDFGPGTTRAWDWSTEKLDEFLNHLKPV
jgi:hypothetical protein